MRPSGPAAGRGGCGIRMMRNRLHGAGVRRCVRGAGPDRGGPAPPVPGAIVRGVLHDGRSKGA